MTISGLTAAANLQPPATQQVSPSSAHHRHNNKHPSSISDVDAQSSSLAATASTTRKVGGTIDITA